MRDLYKYIKKRFIKGACPKVVLEQSFHLKSVSGAKPRNYCFENYILIRNIDTKPIYGLKLYQTLKSSKILKKEWDFLNPTEIVEMKEPFSIPYGDSGNKPLEALEKIPLDIKTPVLTLTFIDKEKHKFTLKKSNGIK